MSILRSIEAFDKVALPRTNFPQLHLLGKWYASMVSKISIICQRFKETLGVRITRKLGDLDLDATTSFVTTSQLAASAEENITREGRGMGPSQKQIADFISAIREESSISLIKNMFLSLLKWRT